MGKLHFNNKWVLVTGASAGLGEEIAKQLAFRHKANLILLARRKEKLEKLKEEIEKQTNVQVKVVVADLSKLDEVDKALDTILKEGQLYGAVLNAGITYFGRHKELPWTNFETMLQTNVVSVTRMTNRLVDHFESTGNEGGLLIVSSMAAIFPVPYQAAYSGTKSFILSFATALTQELSNSKFSISVYAPGGIVSEMTAGEKFNDLRGWLMPVDKAAREAIRGFMNRKLIHIPGFTNRMGSVLMKFMPKKFIMSRLSSVYRKSLVNAEKKD
jgi:hypothetical protein